MRQRRPNGRVQAKGVRRAFLHGLGIGTMERGEIRLCRSMPALGLYASHANVLSARDRPDAEALCLSFRVEQCVPHCSDRWSSNPEGCGTDVAWTIRRKV